MPPQPDTEKTLLVFDGDNFAGNLRNLGLLDKIDLARLVKSLLEIMSLHIWDREFYDVVYFISIDKGGCQPQRPFIEYLTRHIKYTKVKSFVKRADVELVPRRINPKITMRGYSDREIIDFVLRRTENFHALILVTGDGHFIPMVEKLVSLGKKVIIVSTAAFIHPALKEVAHEFVDITGLQIERG